MWCLRVLVCLVLGSSAVFYGLLFWAVLCRRVQITNADASSGGL
jgi:hypothetical protein